MEVILVNALNPVPDLFKLDPVNVGKNGHVKGCFAGRQCGIHFCTGGYKCLYNVMVPVECGKHEGCFSLGTELFQISLGSDEKLDHRQMPVGCCGHEWGYAIGVGYVE
jgi:hypothetical protein